MHPQWPPIKLIPADPILALTSLFQQDSSENPINVGVGAYKNALGAPHEFRAVRSARAHLQQQNAHANHQYLPMSGTTSFTRAATSLIYPQLSQQRIAAVQTGSGTLALHLALLFAKRVLNISTVALPLPSWANHPAMITDASLNIHPCRYYNTNNNLTDIHALLQDLSTAPHHSLVLLQPCAHNPTGADLSQHEWEMLADLVQNRHLLPVFDMAYQGFSTADTDLDVAPITTFVNRGIHLMVAQSFSKNLGLYNSRVGTLSVVVPEGAQPSVQNIQSQLVAIIRTTVGSPAAYGARIVHAVLTDDARRAEWKQEIVEVVARMRRIRSRLRAALQDMDVPGDWKHITNSNGMFVFLGIGSAEVQRLQKVHHVYMTADSRVNIAGLTEHTVGLFASRVAEVVAFRERQHLKI